MKKLLTLAIILSGLVQNSTLIHAMDRNKHVHVFEDGAVGISPLAYAAMCKYKVEKPIPQEIKDRFIQKVLESVPELKTRTIAHYRFMGEKGMNPNPEKPEDAVTFKNYAFHPQEPELKKFGYPNHYRVFIGAHCPADLLTEDVVPCFATMTSLPPALVRADLQEILLYHPLKGHCSVDEWRDVYNKSGAKDCDEFLIQDWLQPFPGWFN